MKKNKQEKWVLVFIGRGNRCEYYLKPISELTGKRKKDFLNIAKEENKEFGTTWKVEYGADMYYFQESDAAGRSGNHIHLFVGKKNNLEMLKDDFIKHNSHHTKFSQSISDLIKPKTKKHFGDVISGLHDSFSNLAERIIMEQSIDVNFDKWVQYFKNPTILNTKMKFDNLVDLVLEQNIIDVVDDNWSVKKPTNSSQMTDSIFQGAYISWQMRNSGYLKEDIKKYFDLRRKNMSHEDALKQIPPPKPKEINYQDPEVQRKIIQAFKDLGYNTQEDVDAIVDMLRPERIDSLKTSMLVNRMDINKILNLK